MDQTWRTTAKESRRTRYLEQAARLFAERGYAGVSITDLGEAAGVSGPALYKHFTSKEAVLVELLVDASERLVAGCAEVLGSGEPDAEVLAALVGFHIDFALAQPDIIRIQDRELGGLPEEAALRVRRLQRGYVQSWVAVLARLRPEVQEAELRFRVQSVFGMLNATPFSLRDMPAERASRVLSRMAVQALLDEGSAG